MPMTLVVHILAGFVAIVSGFVALYAAKGAATHRNAGLVFVYSMLAMALFGAGIAAARGAEASVSAGMLAAYLVVTGLATVRPGGARLRWLDAGALLVGLSVAAGSAALGMEAVSLGGAREGIPAVVLFLFAGMALLGSAGDARMMWAGAPRGGPRLARHLWRMCFALYIASASFFLGQVDELPQALRIPLLLMVPAFAPIVTMAYWLWRVRVRRRLPGRAADGSARATRERAPAPSPAPVPAHH
jgi:hypothetical protein